MLEYSTEAEYPNLFREPTYQVFLNFITSSLPNKASKEDILSVAILSSKAGYAKFKVTENLKLVIDPNRYLDKQERTRLRMQNIQYVTVE